MQDRLRWKVLTCNHSQIAHGTQPASETVGVLQVNNSLQIQLTVAC